MGRVAVVVAVVAVVGLAVLVAVPRLRGGGEVASEAATPPSPSAEPTAQPTATPSATPTAGATPTTPATPTASPSATSAGEAPPVTETATPAAPDQVDPAVLRSHVEALDAIAAANGGVRAAGTPGYDASVAWAHGVLEEMGLLVTEQPFEVQTFRQEAPTTVDLEGDADDWVDGRDLRALLFAGTGTGEGPIAIVDQGCSGAGFDGFPAGAVAVVAPGDCPPRESALNAWDAGAAGALIESPFLSENGVLRNRLLDPCALTVPSATVSVEVAEVLRAAAGDTVRLATQTSCSAAETRNVVGDPPVQPDAPLVMLGAHLDSVVDGPGVNDNGSGVAAVLEAARVLTVRGVPVRVGLWAAEEYGLFGAFHYVETLDAADRDGIGAYLNADMLGSPNAVNFVYDPVSAPEGSDTIATALIAALAAQGVDHELLDLGQGSDHAAFVEAGIPVGGLFTGANEVKTADQAAVFGGTADTAMDPCYHLDCDVASHLDLELLAQLTEAYVAAAVALTAGG